MKPRNIKMLSLIMSSEYYSNTNIYLWVYNKIACFPNSQKAIAGVNMQIALGNVSNNYATDWKFVQ